TFRSAPRRFSIASSSDSPRDTTRFWRFGDNRAAPDSQSAADAPAMSPRAAATTGRRSNRGRRALPRGKAFLPREPYPPEPPSSRPEWKSLPTYSKPSKMLKKTRFVRSEQTSLTRIPDHRQVLQTWLQE